ncbi:DUF1127 domain-containing protein [Thalassococcus lentus]|uniref:DUF1127 domain-containing protein n=1 Tax=Thalassococcus lentus TaxID=1210524 RepID=A0ABT4XSR6_9RHOB|nr:DUF1127 domain-containing protein [Thalassococcus lentus]MDA7424999.1 DUF1127 domain-containing protein [Thalassococcus lentus]
MANVTYSEPRGRSFFGAVLQGIGDFFVAITESNWRVREAERLQAMSDQELAQRGLRREDIARHVFRDMLHI